LGFPQVSRYVLVTFDATDLDLPDIDQILAQTINALKMAGAQQVDSQPRNPAGGEDATVIYTVQDPNPALLEANRLAAARAHAKADAEAKILGVRITGILDARVNRPLELTLPRLQTLSIPDELHLQYYSTSKDGLRIPATFAVEYSIR
jgi:hypothetical protein